MGVLVVPDSRCVVSPDVALRFGRGMHLSMGLSMKPLPSQGIPDSLDSRRDRVSAQGQHDLGRPSHL
jgi:hypothetical protein